MVKLETLQKKIALVTI